MPLLEVIRNEVADNGVQIFYRTYGHGPTKVLFIIGLAASHESWIPQIKGLTGTEAPNDVYEMAAIDRSSGETLGADEANGRIEACAFDNRGVGQSSVPTRKSEYSTKIMAKDAIALLDHLGWKEAHVFGHSMGAMIACKLAAMVPHRILSLALLNVTGGGYQCLPKLDVRTISVGFRFLRAKTPEQRAAVDLDTHYTKEFLEEVVGSSTRRAHLHQQYVRGISSSGMQSSCGFDGQVNACWNHKMTNKELESICSAGFLISIIHGRYDIVAQIYYARKLAEKLYPFARMVDLHGGHLVGHERIDEVNEALVELIKASQLNLNPCDWTNLPEECPGRIAGREGCAMDIVGYLQLFLLYIFSLLVSAFEYVLRALKSLKQVRVGPSHT